MWHSTNILAFEQIGFKASFSIELLMVTLRIPTWDVYSTLIFFYQWQVNKSDCNKRPQFSSETKFFSELSDRGSVFCSLAVFLKGNFISEK